MAIARDQAFAFVYPHLLDDWRAAGAEISLFSPLADQGPDLACDAVFLPGGYPELHAAKLAGAGGFHAAMRAAADKGARVYGECGGYMVLGDVLTDADGTPHPMLGLLPHETSFATRKLTLGYRKLTPLPGAAWNTPLMGHEFHYSTVTSDAGGARLFDATDALGQPLEALGLVRGTVSGSYAHVISPARGD
jgi:cobyrinic acid a,c-diamide synthase